MEKISHGGQRFYEADSVLGAVSYPSITSVLSVIRKKFLETWRGSLGNDACDLHLEMSAERGTRIHESFEVLLNGGIILYNPRSKPNFTQSEIDEYKQTKPIFVLESSEEVNICLKIKQFLNIVKPTVLFTEKVVFSHEIRSAGTLDGLVFIKHGYYKVNGRTPLELEEGNYLIDLKTGSSISEEYYLQVAAYIKCALDMKLVNDIKGGLILHTNSKNKSGIAGFGTLFKSFKDLQDDLEVYKHALALWEYKNSSSRPQIYTVPTMIQ